MEEFPCFEWWLAVPIGFTSLFGLKAFNKDNERKDKF